MKNSLNTYQSLKNTCLRPENVLISRASLFKAIIHKSLRRLLFLADLTFELNNNPSVSKTLGFNPLAPSPSIERFSLFLHDIKNYELKSLHKQLVKELIKTSIISGKSIAIDSCPIIGSLCVLRMRVFFTAKTPTPIIYDKQNRHQYIIYP